MKFAQPKYELSWTKLQPRFHFIQLLNFKDWGFPVYIIIYIGRIFKLVRKNVPLFILFWGEMAPICSEKAFGIYFKLENF